MPDDEPRGLEWRDAYEGLDPMNRRIGDESIRVLLVFLTSMARILGYQRITIQALEDFRRRGVPHSDPVPTGSSIEELAELVRLINRKSDVEFLESERADSEVHVVGQSVLSMWSTLEVFVGDLLLSLLTLDRSLFKYVHDKHRVGIADFYAMDDEERIVNVIRLVRSDSEVSPGVGAFEPVFKAFKLGGSVPDVTRRTILEFVAVRNCLAHRQGVVDKRFLDAYRPTKLKLGETIRLTQDDASRYYYAAGQYASAVTDRVWAKYTPWDPNPMTAKMLESLDEAVAKLGHPV